MAEITASLAWLLPDPEHSVVARWLLVLGYLLAAACWLRASRAQPAGAAPAGGGWWVLGAAVLLLLAANKMFDLRDQCAGIFRALAKAGGWYNQREAVQFVLALVLPIVLAFAAGAFLAFRARAFIARNPMALAGWLLLLLYLGLRQSQEWKPVLPWLKTLRYHDWRLALEAAGIVLVILAGFRARSHRLRGSTPGSAS